MPKDQIPSLVQCGQRVADARTASEQRGQVFVGATGAGFISERPIRNTTKATMTKVMTLLRNRP